ncbi:MAG: hypothetical protein H7Z72_11895 [Bacteroidetes bacterium]|nr:hypothetical protein [Fibrella sp.]
MLETIYKTLTGWLTDLLGSLVSLLKVVVQSRFGAALPAPQRPTCSVLGNGPSLNDSLQHHLAFIRETELVVVNSFALTDIFLDLMPQNYALHDPGYFFRTSTSVRPDIQQTIDVLIQTVTWPMNLYVPRRAKHSYLTRQIEAGNPGIQVIYYNYTVVTGFQWLRHGLYRRNLGMVQSQTVLMAALFLMVNRRFREVYIFGADQSWHEQIRVTDTNEFQMQNLHFYDKGKTVSFAPTYNAGQGRGFAMASQFLSLYKVFRGYEVLRDYANELDVNVLNASSKSYIDAFDRVRLPSEMTTPSTG